MNEDVNAYLLGTMRGQLFFTTTDVMLVQVATQKNKGGMTETYQASGTYVKSFYAVMMAPSAVKISTIGVTHHRFHHHINWNNVAPKILNESHKK